MGNKRDLLDLLIYVSSLAHPFSKVKEDNEGYWTSNKYMNVPQERWLYNYYNDIPELNRAYQKQFGPSSENIGGWVDYTPDDEYGLWANINIPKDTRSGTHRWIKSHEERHAGGELHPQYPRATLEQLFNAQRRRP